MTGEDEKRIDKTVSIPVNLNDRWCGIYCPYLETYEPRCDLYDDGPLEMSIGENRHKYFVRCNECMGRER